MRLYLQTNMDVTEAHDRKEFLRRGGFSFLQYSFTLLLGLLLASGAARAQVNVLTAHNDNARTGQNLNETILTPSNVNSGQFGKLFSVSINGGIYGQPLYVSQLAIPGKGTHNVVFIETISDYIYALDADTNGGVAASPLWRVSLLTNSAPSGTYTTNFGAAGTPVIDLTTNTMYVVSSEFQGSAPIYRLHALDITTGAEKFGGPTLIQGSVPGTGSGSSGGVLTFDPNYERQRAGLLLLNGVLYVSFGSTNDTGPWHGWIFSYGAATLNLIDIFSTGANGSGSGIWMGGAALAAEVSDPAKPYGRMFLATGNGSYNATKPYSNTMSYGMTVLDLDLAGGKMTVSDEFTPFNWSLLNSQDGDLGSGAPVLLPAQTLASGATLNPLVQVGKSGAIYILDRNNLGGFNSSGDQIVQKVQTPESGSQDWGAGIWGTSAYWNNTLYLGGTNPGAANGITAYSFVNGVLSASPTSQSTEVYPYPSPTPSISANGTQNGIVWVLDTSAYHVGPAILAAYDATNLSSLLYSSNENFSRDNPGEAIKFSVPTVANGKVYVNASGQFDVYGLLNSVPTAPAPVITPASATFTGSQTVTITDGVAGAAIYYTIDGTAPTVASNRYTGPFQVTQSETVTAFASVTGYLQSPASAAVFSSAANAANPVISLTSGEYSGPQTVSITDASVGAKIYYTVDGTTPTSTSAIYTKPIVVPVSETVRAIATAPGLLNSSVVAAAYDINPVYTFNFSAGFAQAQPAVQFNGSTDLDDFRLQLTNGEMNEAGSAFYATPVNIQAFTTDFTFQLSNPAADGITFTIQNDGPTALGGSGQGLGYVSIQKSVAIKFDILNNKGEGPNSTGLYIDGNTPTVPAINLTGTSIDLHSGNYINAHITYDGVNLTMTLTNTISLKTWSYSWPINIPATVHSNTAWVGFTGSTGVQTASQKVTSWTYVAGPPALPNFPVGFDTANLSINGAALSGTSLQLTNGHVNQTNSVYYSAPLDIENFTTDFDFTINKASTALAGDGFTFVIQNAGPQELGGAGGGLGYTAIPNSVAIKFDVFNNSGEGTDSTGFYINGAAPTVPSIDLTSSGLVLSNGDLIHAHITYDGTTLTWTLQDLTSTVSRETATEQVVVNIPNTIHGNTAYVGFTGASGGATAVQNILDWTFANQ